MARNPGRLSWALCSGFRGRSPVAMAGSPVELGVLSQALLVVTEFGSSGGSTGSSFLAGQQAAALSF